MACIYQAAFCIRSIAISELFKGMVFADERHAILETLTRLSSVIYQSDKPTCVIVFSDQQKKTVYFKLLTVNTLVKEIARYIEMGIVS